MSETKLEKFERELTDFFDEKIEEYKFMTFVTPAYFLINILIDFAWKSDLDFDYFKKLVNSQIDVSQEKWHVSNMEG